MAPRTQPEQHPPQVQWLRLRYARRGRARFTSHRDFGRAFERALRRARVPMAYSSGFSPHPRISYANASPTGAASEAEYVEIGLATECDPERVRAALDAALPPGLDVVGAQVAPGDTLADLLTGSRWQIDLVGVDPEVAERAVRTFLGRDSIEVSRMTKSGLRTFDARSAVRELRWEPGRLTACIEHQVPLVRPDDLLTALAEVEPAWRPTQ
ncbi:MAG TPA: TIGR03936 family radical SAM-associated protein, partial [Microlunatus sp.]|nr:TIGR03936 family radical SAM-associated protein [Microlunatus sp.]